MCFGPKQQTPITVPAGGSIALECELSLKKTGPFEVQIDLHLEENGIRTVPVTVRGVAIATEGAPNATPP